MSVADPGAGPERPRFSGLIYDRAGRYQLAWWLGAGFNALALVLLVLARPPAARSLA